MAVIEEVVRLVKRQPPSGQGLAVMTTAKVSVQRLRRPAASPRPMAILRLLDDQETELAVNGKAVRIGRGDGNDIVLRNTSVSEFHAQLHMGRDGRFNITDLNSTNGVRVNGLSVETAALKPDDLIELGEVRMRFEALGA